MDGGELLLARFSDFQRRESTMIVHAVVAPQIDAACRNSSLVLKIRVELMARVVSLDLHDDLAGSVFNRP